MKKPHTRKPRTRVVAKRRELLARLDLSRALPLAGDGMDVHDGAFHGGRKATGDGSLSLSLRSVRLAAGKTQSEVSRVTGIAQGDVSRLEQRGNLDECQVSTLRRFVVALGGRLDVRAVFAEGRTVALRGWEEPDL